MPTDLPRIQSPMVVLFKLQYLVFITEPLDRARSLHVDRSFRAE